LKTQIDALSKLPESAEFTNLTESQGGAGGALPGLKEVAFKPKDSGPPNFFIGRVKKFLKINEPLFELGASRSWSSTSQRDSYLMFFLKRNLPNWERALRIAMGVAVGWAVYSGSFSAGLLTWAAVATAATLVLTAFVGFCPACAMVGRRYLER
jgi:hypothetical protein